MQSNCVSVKLSDMSLDLLNDWRVSAKAVSHAIAANAHLKGFHTARYVHNPEMAVVSDTIASALIASEVGELIEAIRSGPSESEHIAGFLNIEEELADIVIRSLEMGASRGYDVPNAVLAKAWCNEGRLKMHGNKAF